MFPLNIGSLMLAPTIVFVVGIVRTKFGLVELPCPLFTVLVILVFTESIGDMSCDLSSGTVGELCTRSYSGASVNSLDSSFLRSANISLLHHKNLRLSMMQTRRLLLLDLSYNSLILVEFFLFCWT